MRRETKEAVVRTPIVGRVVLFAYRTKQAVDNFTRPLPSLLKWLVSSKEIGNFTYHLEDRNKRYLASLLAEILNLSFGEIMAFFREIEEDGELAKHISTATERSDWSIIADKEVRFGRRIGWYAIARAIKPKIVVETGVDKGLGSCVLTAALKRNSQEGHPGRYYGIDIDPKAGYLLTGDYANYGSILYGDGADTLDKFSGIVDLYVNDSDHSAEYEGREYRAGANKLSEHAIILGDNSHVTDKLLEFSLATNRNFVFFQEKPIGHWYPGAGIGISYKR